MSEHRTLLGIDSGGSGIKGAPIDPETGQFRAEQAKYATPEHSTPEAVAGVVQEIAERFPETAGRPLIETSRVAPRRHRRIPEQAAA